MLLSALDQTIVVTAMPTIAADLGDPQDLPWIVTAYLVAATVVTPLYGKFADVYGRRRVILIGVATFVIGSVACALAPSMAALAGARVVQGLGGGGLISLAPDDRRRSRLAARARPISDPISPPSSSPPASPVRRSADFRAILALVADLLDQSAARPRGAPDRQFAVEAPAGAAPSASRRLSRRRVADRRLRPAGSGARLGRRPLSVAVGADHRRSSPPRPSPGRFSPGARRAPRSRSFPCAFSNFGSCATPSCRAPLGSAASSASRS